MFDSHFSEFIVLFTTGLGWGLLSLFRIFSRKLSHSLQATGMVAFIALCGLSSYLLTDNVAILLGTIGLLSLFAIPSFILSLPSSQRILHRLVSVINRPLYRQLFIGCLGLLLVVVSVFRFDKADNEWLECQDAWLAEVASRPATTPVESQSVITDRGRNIVVAQPREPRDRQTVSDLEAVIMKEMPFRSKTIRREEASDNCNCHGWAFTEGKYWIGGDDVQKILNDNGYLAVESPQPGDLAIFRQGNSITHTSIVRYVAEGQPVVVEGKWGWMGVFLHFVDQGAYGLNFTYYRSPRSGHLLAGLNPATPPTNTTLTSTPTSTDDGANLSSSNGGN